MSWDKKKLAHITGWGGSDNRTRLGASLTAVFLTGFVFLTLESGPTTEDIKAQVTEGVRPEVERLAIEASTQGVDLITSAKYVENYEFGAPTMLIRLDFDKIPKNCVRVPLMVWLVASDRSVVKTWRPKLFRTVPVMALPVHDLDSGIYYVAVQACGGSWPPSEGQTTFRIP